MGTASSRKRAFETAMRDYRELFSHVALSEKQLDTLHKVYCKIDADHSGRISHDELLHHVNEERSLFVERIFEMFDLEVDGEVTFPEFVVTAFMYCSLDDRALTVSAPCARVNGGADTD